MQGSDVHVLLYQSVILYSSNILTWLTSSYNNHCILNINFLTLICSYHHQLYLHFHTADFLRSVDWLTVSNNNLWLNILSLIHIQVSCHSYFTQSTILYTNTLLTQGYESKPHLRNNVPERRERVWVNIWLVYFLGLRVQSSCSYMYMVDQFSLLLQVCQFVMMCNSAQNHASSLQ